MNEESLKNIEVIQKHVDLLNDASLDSPFSFTWSPPTNHRSGRELTYFCIHLHHSLIQEVVSGEGEEIIRNTPLSILYYFGTPAMDLERGAPIQGPKELYLLWNKNVSEAMGRYLQALTSVALGDEGNPNWWRS